MQIRSTTIQQEKHVGWLIYPLQISQPSVIFVIKAGALAPYDDWLQIFGVA